MADTVDEFVAKLERFGQDATNMADILTDIGTREVAKIKQQYTQSGLKTGGPLYNSIRAVASDTELIFTMKSYGAYNNYGVSPTPSYKNGGNSPFSTPDGHAFRYKTREFGLPSRQFYDEADITSRMILDLELELTKEFN